MNYLKPIQLRYAAIVSLIIGFALFMPPLLRWIGCQKCGFSKLNLEIAQQKSLIESFDILIDFALVIKKCFQASCEFRSLSRGADLNHFITAQIERFSFCEVRFKKISERLIIKLPNDEMIKEISDLALKFSSFSGRYIDIILSISKDPSSLDFVAIKSRNWEEFIVAWEALINVARRFTDKYKKLLVADNKKNICKRIREEFKDDVDLFFNTFNEKGCNAALHLPFETGAWFPLTILLSIEY